MPEVVVAGSINMDVVASAPRHPQLGETVTGSGLERFPGGKGANQAVAAARAGATVRMLGTVGSDADGASTVRFLGGAGVDAGLVRVRAGVPTGTALIVVNAAGENTIVVVPGANACLDEEAVLAPRVREGDVLVTQYETPRPATLAFLRHGRESGATCIVNPAPAEPTSPELLELVDILVLNETELAVLSDTDVPGDATGEVVAAAVAELQATGFAGLAVTTLGARGVVVMTPEGLQHIPGHRVEAADTTGAGDCFVGSLAAELARGVPIQPAIQHANAAAALCVTKPGAGPSMPTRAEVDAFRGASPGPSSGRAQPGADSGVEEGLLR